MTHRLLAIPAVVVLLPALFLSSCSTNDPSEATQLPGSVPELDEPRVAAGRELYQQYCASCHGADLAGEEDWKIPKADGSYPAPPHDSSGHTWHHSDQLLVEIVRDGLGDPRSSMPTYGSELDDAEVLSIVEYFKSAWGEDERMFQWQVTQQESQRGN